MVSMIAALATASWAAVHAVAPLISDLPLYMDKFVELVRYAAWIFFLLTTYSSRVEEADHPLTSLRWIPWYVIGVMFVVVVLVALPSLRLVFTFSEIFNQYATHMIWLVLSLLGLVLVEQIYRNSPETELPSIKYTCLGLGFLFAYDFFMYAEAVAVQQVDEVLWQARGAAIAVTALLLCLLYTSPSPRDA